VGYKLSELPGVPDGLATSLQELGIDDSEQLLLATAERDDLFALAEQLGVSNAMLVSLSERADLLRVPGVGPTYSVLLGAVGITTIGELRRSGPDLHDRLLKAGATLNVRGLPSSADVEAWVQASQAMPDARDWALATRRDALRAGFAAEDWVQIKWAPLAAAALVVNASPSDAEDTAAELWGAAAAVNAARAAAPADGLINVAFSDDLSDDDIAQFMADAPRESLIGIISTATTRVAGAVDATQLLAYQTMILDVAFKTAGSAKEGGGFLGMGKKMISDEEQAAMDEIRTAVGA
jgi:hypothetical protein